MSVIVNSAALYVYIYSASGTFLLWSDYLGIVVWLTGFIIEWIGDNQLKNHLADKTPGKKKFI
jgi:steroid 5-alpha reductase family enzyme